MIVLAFETSTTQATLVVGRSGPEVLAAQTGPARGHASTLVLTIQRLLREAGVGLGDLTAIGVGLGPGSFTGLRIGVAAAKTLAYVQGLPVHGLDSFAILAASAPATAGRIRVAADAQRGDLFAADFEAQPDGRLPRVVVPPQLIPREAWLPTLQPGDTVTGPVLLARDLTLPEGIARAPVEAAGPSPLGLLRTCLDAVERGQPDDPMRLLPHYLRRSAAEEKAAP